ncbi:two-component sensor histidine kinase [Microtetraspora sp. NBRC 16547]|nr:two-component sensor histidine kinase [Microtetraspora sp. NBRC 16547]
MEARKIDALMALGALTGIVAGTYGGLSSSGAFERPLDPLGLALITVAAPALVFRRRAPLAVGVVTVVCAVVYYACHYPGVFAAAPALVSIYTAATLGRRRLAIVLAVAMDMGIYGLIALSDTDPSPSDGFNLLGGWLVAMVVLGEVTRNRRAYLHEVEQRAIEAERTREEAALRRAGEERLWIAQELHDSLTHSISVINVQVSVAMQLLDQRPERAREALVAIKESGHEAMRELRATLGVLRQAELDAPQAGLARLPRLVSRAEAAGLPVRSSIVGDRRDLPEEIDRTAYRIVQEAFTNVLRHAGPATITLTTEYHPEKIVVRVVDDGHSGGGAAGHGMGLIGMRERVVALGGSLSAGPRPEGGFGVHAELPLGERP